MYICLSVTGKQDQKWNPEEARQDKTRNFKKARQDTIIYKRYWPLSYHVQKKDQNKNIQRKNTKQQPRKHGPLQKFEVDWKLKKDMEQYWLTEMDY